MTIAENNLSLTVDYGVAEDQTAFELDLSPEADIPAQLQAIVDAALAKGVTLTGFVTARKNLTKMRNNAALQKAINGNIGAGALVSTIGLSGYLETEFGLSRVITNDLTYGADAKISGDGRPVITNKRYFPEDTFSFFAAAQSGHVGVGLWGDPPEATVGTLATGGNSASHPYVYIDQGTEDDPKVLWTKASSLFIPVLYNPSSLWIAKVKSGESGAGAARLTELAGKEAAAKTAARAAGK